MDKNNGNAATELKGCGSQRGQSGYGKLVTMIKSALGTQIERYAMEYIKVSGWVGQAGCPGDT